MVRQANEQDIEAIVDMGMEFMSGTKYANVLPMYSDDARAAIIQLEVTHSCFELSRLKLRRWSIDLGWCQESLLAQGDRLWTFYEHIEGITKSTSVKSTWRGGNAKNLCCVETLDDTIPAASNCVVSFINDQ